MPGFLYWNQHQEQEAGSPNAFTLYRTDARSHSPLSTLTFSQGPHLQQLNTWSVEGYSAQGKGWALLASTLRLNSAQT